MGAYLRRERREREQQKAEAVGITLENHSWLLWSQGPSPGPPEPDLATRMESVDL